MFFYLYKKIIAQLQLAKGVTKESLKVDRYMFLHTYRIMYIASLLTNPTLSLALGLLSAVAGICFCIMGYKFHNLLFYVFAIFLICVLLVISLSLRKINKMLDEGKSLEDIQTDLIDKMLNIYLFNPLVISYKDWKRLKEVSKTNYQAIRSMKSIAECYESTFYIANILKKKQLKIMWLLNYYSGQKYGHAVLVKGNGIYDSNRRKTYSKSKYLKINQSEVYKEFSIEEYLYENQDKLIEEGIVSGAVYQKLRLDWENFKSFCNEKGGVRCNNDLC